MRRDVQRIAGVLSCVLAAAGCKRIVFASSVNAVLGYRGEVAAQADDPVFPQNVYGATKCWGEALARYYADVLKSAGFDDEDILITPHGETVTMEVTLVQPIAMEQELRFAIREGGRTVGAGVVTEIKE